MVAGFPDHAASHDGLHADLIRDVAADLHAHTAAVALMAADLESTGRAPDADQERDLARFADHLAACAGLIQGLSHGRRAG